MTTSTSPELQRAITATLARSAPLRARVAPFGLLRMATLPYSRLDALRLPQAEGHIQALFGAEAEMEQLRPALEDALFALVSTLHEDDNATRRAVLNAKRQIHAGGTPPATIDVVQAALQGPQHEALLAWRAAEERRRASLAAARTSFGEELQTVARPALRAPLGERLFHSALALASGGVAATAARERKLPTKFEPDNFERSLFGYLVRAAGKTSPFSTFMASAAVPVALGAPCPRPTVEDRDMQRRVRMNRGMLARLARAAARGAQVEGTLPVQVNGTLASLGENRYRALCERDMIFLGRPWREQRRAQFQLHAAVGPTLLQAPSAAPHAAWRERLIGAGIDASQADGLLDKLFERGILKAPALWDAFDPVPETALLAFLRAQPGAASAERAILLEQMDQLCRQLAGDDSAERALSVAKVGELEKQLMAHLGIGDQEPLRNAVLEDCWTSGVKGELGPELLAPLNDLQGFLATQVEFSPEYLRLVDYFVEEYGAGGSCDDLTAFLLKYGDRLIDPVEYGIKPTANPTRRAMQHACLGVTAQVDIAFGPGREPLMVVNKVYDRPGWLAARFAFGEESGQEFLRDSLQDWLKTVSGPCEPVDVLVNGDCNDLQAHPRVTRRVLQWHGEALTGNGEGVLRPDDLRIRHDQDSGLLALTDRDGVALSLVYLGSTMPTPSWGTAYALSILTQPFRLMRPAFSPPSEKDEEVEDVVFKPRRQRGQLVLSRDTWWVRADYLNKVWFGAQGVDRSIAVERERLRLNLPQQMFAQAMPDPGKAGQVGADALKGDRKPLWIDTRVPFCLSMLQRMTERNGWIALTEMLPGPQDHWLKVNGEAHVCEIQVELLVSADTGTDPMTGAAL
jgi:hypothetical protein